MSAPPISVVLPAYNADRFIGLALDSLATQTHSDFEALVIDDGSTDRSLELARKHVGNDPRFRIVSRPNKGLVATLNEGIALASGKYIFRMDADDVSHPERFAAQVAYLERNASTVAVGTRMMLADEELWPIVEMINSFTHDEIDAENLLGAGSAMCHPSVAMRRDTLIAVGGYRAEYECAEDLDLFLRMAEVGRLANLPRVLLTYRQHLASIGYAKRHLQAERTALAVHDARRRRGRNVESTNLSSERGDTTDVASSYHSVAEIHRKWSWLALAGGHPSTARKHAFKATRLQPLSPANPRLLACVLRGR